MSGLPAFSLSIVSPHWPTFQFRRFRGRHQTLEVVQSNSVTVERAAFYLSQAVQSSPDDDAVFGPDSPAVSLACKEQAALLLLDLLAQGGELTVLKGDR